MESKLDQFSFERGYSIGYNYGLKDFYLKGFDVVLQLDYLGHHLKVYYFKEDKRYMIFEHEDDRTSCLGTYMKFDTCINFIKQFVEEYSREN